MFQKLLKKIAVKFKYAGIPYMIIGGQAVLLYGEPRMTKDIDVTIGFETDKLEFIKKIAKELKLKNLVKDINNFVEKTMVLPVIDSKSGIRVDFIFSFSPYERQAIKRAKTIRLGGTAVKFASLEDVIIHKIIAGRARDIEDVHSILLKNKHYDSSYITNCLIEFDKSLSGNYLAQFKKIKKELK